MQSQLLQLWVIGHAISIGKLEAVENWTEVNFTTPRRVTVDAGREAMQNRADVEAGLKTLTDHFAELGMDIHEEVENRAREMKLIAETAKKYDIEPQLLFAYFKNVQPSIPAQQNEPQPEDFIAT